MDYISPPVNLSGVFKLKTPLENLLNPNVIYKVTKVTSINSLLNDDIDVEKFIFKDHGLTTDDYINALEKQVPIVTLETEGGSIIDVPANYISYMPQISGKIFINKAFIINVGYVPSELDISFLSNELKDLTTTMLGVDNDVSIEEISGKYIVSNKEYTNYEKDRVAKITNKNTCRGNLEKVTTMLNAYKAKLQVLIKKVEAG